LKEQDQKEAAAVIVAASSERVPAHTAEAVNRRIREQAEARIRQCRMRPSAIPRRLEGLDREWDVERVLEANASILAFTGVVLGATVDRRWLALPAAVTAFLFQHAVQGWCPPLPALRRLGFRTVREIEDERRALLDIQKEAAQGRSTAARTEPVPSI
jgi:hypothetical protein